MEHYEKIAFVLDIIAENFVLQPTLAELASALCMSETQLRTLFTDWSGVETQTFLKRITVDFGRQCLKKSPQVLSVSGAPSRRGPIRMNNLVVSIDFLSGAECKSGGAGLEIEYGCHSTQFGSVLIGLSGRGVIWMAFVDSGTSSTAVNAMRQRLKKANYRENAEATQDIVRHIFFKEGCSTSDARPISVCLVGTPFQRHVWEALLVIPEGACTTYRKIADAIDRPNAHRAVGTAVGANPIAYLIPCHRVIRKDGLLGGYRWGEGRKLAILGIERIRMHYADYGTHS